VETPALVALLHGRRLTVLMLEAANPGFVERAESLRRASVSPAAATSWTPTTAPGRSNQCWRRFQDRIDRLKQ
jgi:hypothetical protein